MNLNEDLEIKKFIDSFLDRKTFAENYFNKQVPISIDVILQYIVQNKLEKLFIDAQPVPNIDDFYLICDVTKNAYKIIETERNFVFKEKEYKNLMLAIKDKIIGKTKYNLTKLKSDSLP